ncbi:hypothetical protein M1E17_20465 [Arthrobacter sp. D1-29]
MNFPNEFLWGASTAPHQIEGNNVNSDFWAREQLRATFPARNWPTTAA